MAIIPSSLKLTTSGFLHLQNPFHHLPSTSQTTLTFSTKKILGPNPLAALTLTRAPTNIPTVGISQTFPTIGISQTIPTIGISQTFPTIGISQTFTKLKSQGKVAFIPYITAGDPDLSTTAAALKVLDSCGSDIIELGLPYSDPLLDGPVIRDSATRSLARGTNFNKIISMLKEVVPQLSCPIVLFTYCNPVINHGIEDFMFTISQAGVRGLVVPDVPFENTQGLRNEAAKNNVELVLLTTPTTPTGRMKDIVQASEGFVYLVSSVGVTGARARVNEQVPSLLREVKEATSKPVAVGFGLSKPEHVKQVAEWGADGVIVGSAIVKVLGEAKSPFEGLRQLETLAKSFKSALP